MEVKETQSLKIIVCYPFAIQFNPHSDMLSTEISSDEFHVTLPFPDHVSV